MLTENASKIQQKYLGAKGLIVLIAMMNMFVPCFYGNTSEGTTAG